MLDKLPDSLKGVVKAAANQLVDLASPTTSTGQTGQGLTYGFLLRGGTLSVDASIGNGHTGQVAANVNGQFSGPNINHLSFDAGLNDPLIGQILTISADITVGSLSPSPPPPPRLTISLWQMFGGQQRFLETFNVDGSFDPNNLCRLTTPILLR